MAELNENYYCPITQELMTGKRHVLGGSSAAALYAAATQCDLT